MPLAIDDVHLAVVIDVVGKNGEACVGEMPVGVPLPLVVSCFDVLEPTVGSEDVGFAVVVDVGDTDAVTVLFFATDVMNFRLGTGEGYPEDAGVVVGAKTRSGCPSPSMSPIAPPSVSKLSVTKCFCHIVPGAADLPGFSYHQMPLDIQPVGTRSGKPSWLTSMAHSPQSETNSRGCRRYGIGAASNRRLGLRGFRTNRLR
jgi:hypothetical protein